MHGLRSVWRTAGVRRLRREEEKIGLHHHKCRVHVTCNRDDGGTLDQDGTGRDENMGRKRVRRGETCSMHVVVVTARSCLEFALVLIVIN